jgi:hypothetical protein
LGAWEKRGDVARGAELRIPMDQIHRIAGKESNSGHKGVGESPLRIQFCKPIDSLQTITAKQ